MAMDSRTAFSDSNDISNGSSTCCATTTNNNTNTTTTTTSSDIILSSDTSAPDTAALKRLSDNLDSIFSSDSDTFYADAKVVVPGGREVPVHRCILSARSPFFKAAFSNNNKSSSSREREREREKERGEKGGGVKVELKDLGKELEGFEIGYDSVITVLGYLYSGKVRGFPPGVCVCVDDDCIHVSCRPAVDFMVQLLFLSFSFQINELVALYQRHLLEILDKVASDDLLVVLSVANICGNMCERLLARCVDLIVKSEVDVTTLDKSLPQHIVKQIIDMRKEIGMTEPEYIEFPDKHVKRIHRALESDDVELVRMLLKEGHTTLDDAHALHYAVAHCDAKTTMELLELGLADVNCRNERGYTVLHVAAMRKEPKIIVSLLTKGAQPTDITPDGRKALQIVKRLTKAVDFYRSTEEGKASPKDRLCIEILEQAERREPLLGEGSVSLAKAGEDLRMKLLYLENRVALARLLFPMEAKVAMEIAQVDGTSEFTLSKNLADARRNAVDLNEAPFILKEDHLRRMKALSRTVELGKRFFPRCSEVLNNIMDAEDLSQLALVCNDTPEERLRKRRRYYELQEALTKAFTEDKEQYRSTLSSSSSSTPTLKPQSKINFKR